MRRRRKAISATRSNRKMWMPLPIATPDHWHTPMAVLGLKAGKHVYVEKPSSQNPREGELIVAAQKKYGKLVQVGDQQRSSDYTIKMIEQIHDGYIGETYMAKPGTRIRAAPRITASPSPLPPRSIGIFGRAPRRAANTETTSIPITGTGCAAMAPARR